jgi:hypothetical protein
LRASSKGAFALGLGLELLAWAGPARAEDRLHECVTAHAEGQSLKNEGKLVRARARFAACLAEDCPALVREDCAAFERAATRALGSVVFSAIDQDGRATSEPVVSVDGSETFARLDGRPVLLDPGPHRVLFRHPDGSVRELELTLSEAEQRQVVADFRSVKVDTPPSDGRKAARTAILVSGGLAVVGLGAFTYFGLAGHAIQSDLEECKPNCQNPDDLDRMHARYVAADISLAVALVAAGVGAYVWLKEPAAFTAGHARSAPRLGLRVSPSIAGRGVGVWATGDF